MSQSHKFKRDARSIVVKIMRRLGGKPASKAEEDITVISASGLFDREWYLRQYPDVAAASMDPIHHYVRHGAKEGRNPRADFDTWFYLVENPDVARDGVNPFRHYVEHGLRDGRAGTLMPKRMVVNGALVSIIIPVYNVEKYLAECLDSVVNQTYRNLEIIVVDDGSPDLSYDIASAYARADSRIKVVRRENGGLGAARNTGVVEASGQYLAFMDSDDVLPLDAIGLMVGSLQGTGSDFVVGAIRRLKHGNLLPPADWVKQVHAEDRTNVRLVDFPEILTDVFACNKLFNSDFFRRYVGKFPENIRYEDQEPTARAYLHGIFDVLVGTVYHWRIRDDGTSITQNKSNPDDLRDRLIVKQRMSHILADADISTFETWLAKAIGFDLRSYFEQVPRTDADYFDRLREGMLPLAEKMSPRIWQKIRMVDRLPALAVLAGNRDDVAIAITRRDEYGFFVPGRLNDGAVYLDRSYLEGMALSPEDNLLKFGDTDLSVSTCLTSLSWRNGLLHLEGYAYLTNLEFGSDSWISARLMSGGQSPIELSLRPHRSLRIDQETKDAWNAHADSGFVVDIDPVVLGLNPDKAWRMEITVGCAGLDNSRSVMLRDVDMRGIPDAPVVSEVRGDSRWIAEFRDGAGFSLRCASFSEPHVTAINVENGKVAITIDRSTAQELLLVCGTLHQRVKVPATVIEAGKTEFVFTLPEVSRADYYEHVWHMHLCGLGEPSKLTWAGDMQSFERACPEHYRIRASMDGQGTLRLVQTSWWAVADEVDVDQSAIIVRGSIDAPGALGLSSRLVGETQELAADCVDYDSATQRFELRIPFDPAIGAVRGKAVTGSSGQSPELFQPTMLHGFSLRLKVEFEDQLRERWLRVADDLIRQFPMDKMALHRGLTFTRTPGSCLWVHFRRSYQDDERGRLSQRLLHSSYGRLPAATSRKLPQLENAILFESFAGRQVSDSVLAICNEIVRRKMDVELYWSVDDMSMPVPDGTRPLLIHSREWARRLHCARYLVNNNNFPFYFRKSPGQIYLQTWHGTPLKLIGNHVPQSSLSLSYRRLMQRESRYWDFLLAQNDYAAKILPEAFDYAGRVLNVGYPRNDALADSLSGSRRLSVRNRFGFEPYHFVVLYAPTWRDNLVGARGYSRVSHLDIQRVRKVLGGNAKVILRGHHNTAKNPVVRQPGVIDATHYPDVNDLLLAADLLITDYSSVMFDYVVTDKPVIFLTPDLEQYRDKTRGFYTDLEEMAPGPICHSNEELFDVLPRLGRAVETYSERYREFTRRFASRDDGGAAARVVDVIWGDQSHG